MLLRTLFIMARPLRIEFPGAHYHIFSRGTRKENIYHEDKDRIVFLEKLEETSEKYSLLIHSCVLMNNHYHLHLETPQGNISKAMHYLNTSYTNWFKAKYKIVGSVFQGRYKSILVDKETYAISLNAYIHLNPVRSNIVIRASDYRWSSYKAYLGLVNKPIWLTTNLILNEFTGNKENYQRFVENWKIRTDSGRTENMNGTHSILGTEEFEARIKNQIKSKFINPGITEQPDLRYLINLEAEEIISTIQEGFKISRDSIIRASNNNIHKKILLYSLKRFSNMSLEEIGVMMNMRYSTITENVRRLLKSARESTEIKAALEKCENMIKEKMYPRQN